GQVLTESCGGPCIAWGLQAPPPQKGGGEEGTGAKTYAWTPSTYQSTPQKAPSSITAPAATRSAPVLSLRGPANGWIEPSMMPALTASALATTSAGIFLLKGPISTSPEARPSQAEL